MSTASPVSFEFRCNTCWQALYAPPEESGTEMECPHCGSEIIVPEATEDRIRRAENSSSRAEEAFVPRDREGQGESEGEGGGVDASNWTYSDYERRLKQDMPLDVNNAEMLKAYAAPPAKRFVGHVVDSLAMMAAFVIGTVILQVLIAAGVIDLDELDKRGNETKAIVAIVNICLIAYFLPICLGLYQWVMISSQGQTVGKWLIGTKIIRSGGRPPGFFQGVIIRNWLRIILSIIPFFALVDALFVFTDSRRCIHDYISGTRVIEL